MKTFDNSEFEKYKAEAGQRRGSTDRTAEFVRSTINIY